MSDWERLFDACGITSDGLTSRIPAEVYALWAVARIASGDHVWEPDPSGAVEVDAAGQEWVKVR